MRFDVLGIKKKLLFFVVLRGLSRRHGKKEDKFDFEIFWRKLDFEYLLEKKCLLD